jgi:hypothetical protein
MLLGDTDADNISAGSGEYMWFSDTELEALATLFGGSIMRAGAQALRTVAGSQALLLKKWSADDLTVDGPAITRALRDLAKDLDAAADAGDASLDIFEVSRPGSNLELIPEGMPNRIGRAASPGFQLPDIPGQWWINGDWVIVDD